jgi:hypothetical protein
MQQRSFRSPLPENRGRFVREPSLLPVFGKRGLKGFEAPVAFTAAPAGINSRLRSLVGLHGGVLVKLSVIAWTVLILAAVFFTLRG